jgi:hypothetical protein
MLSRKLEISKKCGKLVGGDFVDEGLVFGNGGEF